MLARIYEQHLEIARRRSDGPHGPASVKKDEAGRFSLGMSQRLAIAASLLGDPKNLVLDEPVNGLDAEGVKWVRDLCRNCAAEGRACC